MLLRVLLEGVGLGVILMLVCAVGIRNGAVGMVHVPDPDALYDGSGSLVYCCRCRAGDEEVYIPVSTLK